MANAADSWLAAEPVDKVARIASYPFALVEELDVACGYERSFKMLPGKLLANRYLLGLDARHLTREQLLGVCRCLQMPSTFVDAFASHLPDANLVFLGFEHAQTRCMYKAYLEFWEQIAGEIRRRPDVRQPVLSHLGFKWDVHDSRRRTVARYMCYPLLSVREILKRMAEICAAHDGREVLEASTEIISRAVHERRDVMLRYLEVTEEGNPRVSYDVNLYAAGLRLSRIRGTLSTLRNRLSIRLEEFHRLYELVGDKLLGHISGGFDRNGEGFLTVYYEV